jgi:tRNA uridine 5-carbamoylmethylation protein Kti12|tara:strand:- start:2127 stop:2273 length:147 start_codon:yes stop_codon:yes gene_type:complete
MKVRKKIKKDNSTKDDYFIYCRSDKCGKFIKQDYRSFFDKRYCKDCMQ